MRDEISDEHYEARFGVKRLEKKQEKTKKISTNKKHILLKEYEGDEQKALKKFREDLYEMEKRGYYPVSQEWIPGSYGCFAFLIAFLLCFIFIGIVAFLYMLIVKPDGKLIVTYEIRKNDEVKVIDKIQKIEQVKNPDASEKTCPMCGETVKEVALICRFCNYDFYDYYCANIMRESGWDARVKSASGGQGIDVIAKIGDVKVVLQCKKYSQPVGDKAVQEVFAGKNLENAQYAAVVTNSTYTPSAKQLAKSNGVYLLHDTQLEKFSKDLISYLQKNNK